MNDISYFFYYCYSYDFFYKGGNIPSELCSTTGMSIDITNTQIDCYSGCLTSAKIVIAGATTSAYCHDGSIMERFVIFVVCFVFIFLLATVYYKFYNGMISTPSWCSDVWCNCCQWFNATSAPQSK